MVDNLKRYLKLFLTIIRMNFNSIRSYSHDFIIGSITFLFSNVMSLCVILFIFSSIHVIDGWNIYEILALQSYSQIILSLNHIFFDNLWNIAGNEVNNGDYDSYMIKPINSLFYACIKKCDFTGLGSLIIGVISFFISSLCSTISLGILLLIPFSLLIVLSIQIISTSFTFFLKKARGILYFVNKFQTFAKYPLTIYPIFLQCILYVVVPFGTAIYLPLVSNKLISLILFSIIFFILALLIYKKAEQHYQSSGN